MNEKLSMSGLARITLDEFQQAKKFPIVLILDNIRSGLNVGSMFRSADAFRIERIICCGYTPVPPHREVLKSALGATESVEWVQETDGLVAVEKLRQSGVAIYALEQTSGSLDLTAFIPQANRMIALIAGNEVNGVSQPLVDACDGSLEIIQFGTKHSLNVAVSVGIALHNITSRMLQNVK